MSFQIARVEAFVLRAPLETPVVTSFGVMRDRPAVVVRVEDQEGAHGWGEIWCNFPACGAEHRARLLETAVAPLIGGRAFTSPEQAFAELETATRTLALQTGEPGPLAQVIAGLDIAVWDLVGRRAGKPLAEIIGGEKTGSVAAYASGIHPDGAIETVARSRAEAGHRAFKIKVGFGRDRDLTAIAAVTDSLGAGERLMIDANQAWDLQTALEMVAAIAEFDLGWLEEPLAADRPWEDWRRLAEAARCPLAGGENLRGEAAFAEALSAFGVVQPDACKWGGISGCLRVARAALAAGRRYCPHFLGGGIGLVASAHLLAAVGGDGLLEVDVNPNPLREALAEPFPVIAEGRLRLPDAAGLGVEPDMRAAADWLVMQREWR